MPTPLQIIYAMQDVSNRRISYGDPNLNGIYGELGWTCQDWSNGGLYQFSNGRWKLLANADGTNTPPFANPLRKTYSKVQAILAGSAQQIGYLVAGDSLAYRKAKYVAANLRSALGTSGLFGIAGQNGGMFTFPITAGNPTVVAVGTDYGRTHTGGYTILDTPGQIVGAEIGSMPAFATTYSPVLNPQIGVSGANRISVLLVKEPGAGTIDVEISSDLVNWTVVQAGLSAANATVQYTTVNIAIASQQVRGVRCKQATGSVKVWGVGAINTLGKGLVAYDMSQGSVDIASANSTPGYAAVLSGFAPDFLTLEARDNIPGVGLAPALPGYEALFATLPERIYIAMNQWSTDTLQSWIAYNNAIEAYAVGAGACYFPSGLFLGDYANTVALNWLTGPGDDHPNDRASFYCANYMLQMLGLTQPITSAFRQSGDPLRLGGVIYSRAVPFNTVGCAAGSVETNLMQYTLPSGVISSDSDTLVIQAKFTTVGGAVPKQIRCYVLGTIVADTGVTTQGGGYEFYVTVTNAQSRLIISRIIQFYNSAGRVDDNQSLAINLALGGIIKFTGSGVSANDVTQQSMLVEFKKSA